MCVGVFVSKLSMCVGCCICTLLIKESVSVVATKHFHWPLKGAPRKFCSCNFTPWVHVWRFNRKIFTGVYKFQYIQSKIGLGSTEELNNVTS